MSLNHEVVCVERRPAAVDGKLGRSEPVDPAVTYRLTPDDLLAQLRAQIGFLDRSSAAFDEGHVDEARRLATVVRVLVHDTSSSHSLLGQLGVKTKIQFLDTAAPICPGNILSTPGLVHFESSEGKLEYRVKLDASIRRNARAFEQWWSDVVTKDGAGRFFRRRDYILTLANKEGGAHVDPGLDAEWAALTRDNSLDFPGVGPAGESIPMGDPAPASVRQIAYEVHQTVSAQLGHLLQSGS